MTDCIVGYCSKCFKNIIVRDYIEIIAIPCYDEEGRFLFNKLFHEKCYEEGEK